MEFNKVVLENINPVLKNYNLKLIEDFKNFLKFKSDEIVIVICHDEREKSNLLYVGEDDNNLFLLDGNIIRKFFNPDLTKTFKIPERTLDDFVNNLKVFFTGSGRILLSNSEEILPDIVEYIASESKIYTDEIIKRQEMEAASKAWNDKDYSAFISNIDKVGITNVPESFKLKYKIAKHKI